MAYTIKATFTKSDNKLWPWEEGYEFANKPAYSQLKESFMETDFGSRFFDPDFVKSPNLCEFQISCNTREEANALMVEYMTRTASWSKLLDEFDVRNYYTNWKFAIDTSES